MTVQELIDKLKLFNPSMRVRVVRDEREYEIEDALLSSNYGEGLYAVLDIS